MSMATHPAFSPCPPTEHRHAPVKRGGRCDYPSQRPGRICGRDPVAAYIHRDAIAWRCARHDRDVVVLEAAKLGYRRLAVAP